MAEICGARNRQGGPCRRPAGWGTEHPKHGRCKLHGGRSPGGPVRNKKAVSTGEQESILLDVLDADEQILFGQVDTDVFKQLDEEIRLTAIRERRMLQRIAALKAVPMTVVELVEEPGDDKGPDGDAGRSVLKRKSIGTLGQIQTIEDGLTRVQERKARLLELKHRLEAEKPPPGTGIQDYVNALNQAADQVWADERPDEDGGEV